MVLSFMSRCGWFPGAWRSGALGISNRLFEHLQSAVLPGLHGGGWHNVSTSQSINAINTLAYQKKTQINWRRINYKI